MSGDVHRKLHTTPDSDARRAAVPVDRREEPDRRIGIDRRGASEPQPPSPQPRPYGLRELGERRGNQDRRLYGIETDRFSPADPPPCPEPHPCPEPPTCPEPPPSAALPFGIMPLSDGELLALLHRCKH